jgi:hypothetical protein
MNEMLALLPAGENKDRAIFLGILLRKLPTSMRDHLAAANHVTAAAMSAHADILWYARCGDSTVRNVTNASITAVASQNFSCDSRRRSPGRRTAAGAVPARVAVRPRDRTTAGATPPLSVFTTAGSDRKHSSARLPVPGRAAAAGR